MSDNYIAPNTNIGILYPNWVTYNYKKYKVKKTPFDPNIDLCKLQKKPSGAMKPRPYQEFLQKYMRFESPYRTILVYHGLGVGKTATSIYIYNLLYNKSKNWNVYILVKKSLFKGWLDELNKFLERSDFKDRLSNVHLINYDSSNANIKFKEIIQDKSNIGKNNLYIIDEVHNFIRNVYSNVTNQQSVRALEIYEHLKREIKDTKETRIICISGTPVINRPYELGLLFNLLRPGIFPNKEDEFNNIFMKNEYSKEINQDTKNLFQRRILGLVSYYEDYHKGLYAEKTIKEIEINMSSYQEKVYDYFEAIEEKLDKKKSKYKKKSGTDTEMFKAYTRQACNFVFPYINKDINGEKRPRPNVYRKSLKGVENDIHKNERNLLNKKNNAKASEVLKLYTNACNKYVSSVEKLWNSFQDSDKKNKISLQYFIDKLKSDDKLDINEFINKNKNKSKLMNGMYNCSPKILYMCFNIIRNTGNALVYTNYVNMEGIQVIKIYFKFFNITKYGEYHGGIVDRELREKTRSLFNDPKNKRGDYLQVIIISPAMTEGVNLANVRHVHILEPHWNLVRIQQVIGRSIRQCSHQNLPMNERNVIVYKYFIKRKNEKPTTDQTINEIATNKYNLLDTFLQAVKEAAIDCELFKEVNQSDGEYSCFKFAAEDKLSKELGYAFRKNIYDDLKKENKGLNSSHYETKKIKTFKIKAVTKDSSTVNEYWYNPDTGYVFDIDVDVLIGRINKDKNNLPEMRDIETYIISNLSELDKYKLSKKLL